MRTWCALFLLAVFPASAWACICSPVERACQAYRATPIIFTGTIVGLDSKEAASTTRGYTQLIHFAVNESFKGVIEQTLAVKYIHVPSSCGFHAPKFALHQLYLVWAFQDGDGNSFLTDCTATRPLGDATQLISELRELRSGAGATYIFGGIYRNRTPPNGLRWEELDDYSSVPLPGTKVVVSSSGRTYSAQADQKGQFMVPLEHGGIYQIAIDLPRHFQQEQLKQEIALEDHECADMSEWTQYEFVFRGRVVDTQGTPIEGVPLSLLLSNKLESSNHTFTNSAGEYELKASKPGEYLVAVNWDEPPSDSAPFPTTLYPGVGDIEKASPLQTQETGPAALSDFRMPPSKTCTLQVQVRDRSGRPEKKANILIKFFPQQFWHSVENVDSEGMAEVTVAGPEPMYVVASRRISDQQELRSPLQRISSCLAKPLVLQLSNMVKVD